MTITSNHGSERSNVSFASKYNLEKTLRVQKNLVKDRMSWEVRQSLAKKRLPLKSENAESGNGHTVSFNAKLNTSYDPRSCVSVSTSAMERAHEVHKNLSIQFPCFLKCMLASHVSSGFQLGLPKQFSDAHLPKHDATVILVGEDEKEYNTKYLGHKNGLSAGWRGFSIAHKLLEGDVLVFQLIESCKFKIYIVRATSLLTEVIGAIDLLKLDGQNKAIDTKIISIKIEDQAEHNSQSRVTAMKKYPKPPAVDDDTEILISDDESVANQSDDDSDNLVSRVVEGIRFSESVINFEDVKDFSDFSIHVNGLVLDSELPTHVRTKYYQLCCSQKKFLHENLINGLNSKLAAGIISEIINIADGIKSTKIITTFRHHLETWDRTLKAFEDLGMVVGFLRAWIHKLLTLSSESLAIIKLKKRERDEAKAMMKDLEAKLLNVNTLVKSLDKKVNDLEVKYEEELCSVFREIAGVSW